MFSITVLQYIFGTLGLATVLKSNQKFKTNLDNINFSLYSFNKFFLIRHISSLFNIFQTT